MDINILWAIFIVTIIIITIIVTLFFIPTLLQLSKTLQTLEKISLQWHNDFDPAIKDLAEITLKANNSLKKIDSGLQLANKAVKTIEMSNKVLQIETFRLGQFIKKEYICFNACLKKGLEIWRQGNKKTGQDINE